MSLVPVTVCDTADQARALAHKHARRPTTPIVRLPTKKVRAAPISVPVTFMSYGTMLFMSYGTMLMGTLSPDNQTTQLSYQPRISEIVLACSRHYRIGILDIMSRDRTLQIVRCRQVAMYLAKTLTLRSLPEIGRRFGGKDHTTVLHAVRKIEGLLPVVPELAADVAAIKSKLGVQ